MMIFYMEGLNTLNGILGVFFLLACGFGAASFVTADDSTWATNPIVWLQDIPTSGILVTQQEDSPEQQIVIRNPRWDDAHTSTSNI